MFALFTVYCPEKASVPHEISDRTKLSRPSSPSHVTKTSVLRGTIKQLSNQKCGLSDPVTKRQSIAATSRHALSNQKRSSKIYACFPPGGWLASTNPGVGLSSMNRKMTASRRASGGEEGPPGLQPITILTHVDIFQDTRTAHDMVVPINNFSSPSFGPQPDGRASVSG